MTYNSAPASNAPVSEDGLEKGSRLYKPRDSLLAHVTELQKESTRQYSLRASYRSKSLYGTRNFDATKSIQSEQRESRHSSTHSNSRLLPSELDPEKRAQLDCAIDAQEEKYFLQITSLPGTLSQSDLKRKLWSLKQINANAMYKIRSQLGVTLRKIVKNRDLKQTPKAQPGLDAPGSSSTSLFSNGPMYKSSPLVHLTNGIAPINIPRVSRYSPLQNSGFLPYTQSQSKKRRRTSEDSRENQARTRA